jgi:hypothetical protein
VSDGKSSIASGVVIDGVTIGECVHRGSMATPEQTSKKPDVARD